MQNPRQISHGTKERDVNKKVLVLAVLTLELIKIVLQSFEIQFLLSLQVSIQSMSKQFTHFKVLHEIPNWIIWDFH